METLKNIIKGIFQTVLQPILEVFIKDIFLEVVEILKDAFAWLIYEIECIFLKYIDFLESVFEFCAGTSKGHVSYKASAGAEPFQGTILDVFVRIDSVQKIFLIMLFTAAVISLIFTIVATVRSISDMTLENKNPISKVIKNAIKTVATFAVIPLFCLFIYKLSGLILDGIDTAMVNSGYENITVSDTIWYTTMVKAAKSENIKKNLMNNYCGSGPYADKKYSHSADCIKNNFNLREADFGIGITASIAISLIFSAMMITFIRRLFELLVLFLVSPYFVMTIPLDDGEMFKKWKDMFVAKFFSGFGSVIAMRLYILVAPTISNTSFELSSNPTTNLVLKMIFIIGGAYAVYSSQGMLLRMLNYEASMAESQSIGLISGFTQQARYMASQAKTAGSRAANGRSGPMPSGQSPASASADNSNDRLRANNMV